MVNRKLIARAMGLGEWDSRVTAIMRDVRAKQLELEQKRAEPVGQETLRDQLAELVGVSPSTISKIQKRIGESLPARKATRRPSKMPGPPRLSPWMGTPTSKFVDNRCVLTRETADEMRHAYQTEKPRPSMRQLAKRYGLRSSSQVCKILHCHSWKA
jgi:hypothetical protein